MFQLINWLIVYRYLYIHLYIHLYIIYIYIYIHIYTYTYIYICSAARPGRRPRGSPPAPRPIISYWQDEHKCTTWSQERTNSNETKIHPVFSRLDNVFQEYCFTWYSLWGKSRLILYRIIVYHIILYHITYHVIVYIYIYIYHYIINHKILCYIT